ncbi:MAG: vitamin B12 dependent methionine synthase [bacterium]|nr:vitamin B12 dependent methionine synthase [bacterium]
MPVLDHIHYELDVDALMKTLRIGAGGEDEAAFRNLLDDLAPRINPKALFIEAYVDTRGEDTVTVSGTTFRSKVLRRNLDRVHRLFPYVVTCGREMDEAHLPEGDFLTRFWLDTIKGAVLNCANRHLDAHLTRQFGLGKTAHMNPGSGDAWVWPIEQQRDLFALLGDVEDLIGVTLTDSMLMVPNKSVSGIRFPVERDFRSCQLCRREGCPGRSVPFDPVLFESVR